MALVQRKIAVTVQLAANTGTNQPVTFAESGSDTVKLEGHRTTVRVHNSGAPVDCHADVKVYGMTPSLMNQLSTLGLVFNIVPRNVLTIAAGDDESGMSNVFTGTIFSAYGDYSAQPNVPFHFSCLQSGADAVIAAPATSFNGSAGVADIMAGFARQMNLSFENNGVATKLSNPYFSGAVKGQAEACAQAAGISWGIVGNVLAIWPKGGNRNAPNVPTISPLTGMAYYPAFTQQGIIVKTVFNPQITFGGLVKIESSLLSGIAGAQPTTNFPTQWAVNKLDLSLDSLVPKGDWLSTIYAYNPQFAKAIIPPP